MSVRESDASAGSTTAKPQVEHEGGIVQSVRSRAARPLLWIGVATVLVAVALRLWVVSGPLGPLSSDETVTGLMARSLLDGEFTTFYWGQTYGGTIEIVPFAALTWALGGDVAIVLLPLLESLTIGVLLYVVTRRRLGRLHAGCTVALAAVFPASTVWFSTRAMLFYQPVMIAGLGALIMSEQLAEDHLDQRRRAWRWAVLGLLLGIGWWSSTQIVFYAIPAIAWIVWHRAIDWWRGPATAAACSMVGAAPWLLQNVRTGGRSLTDLPAGTGSYVDHLRAQAEVGWPMALGLRRPFDERWIVSDSGLTAGLVAAGVIALVVVVVALALVRSPHIRSPLLGVIVVFPLIHALAPSGGYVGTGRYYLFVAPSISYAIIAALSTLRASNRWIGFVLVGCTITTTWTLKELAEVHPAAGPSEQLAAELLERGIEHIYTDYWTAYVVVWEDERILASPNAAERRPDWSQEVRAAEDVAYVFNFADGAEQVRYEEIAAQLRHQVGIAEEFDVGSFRVVIPSRNIPPEELLAAPS
jgi:hypothetical protein